MRKVAVTGLGTINSIAKNTKEFKEELKKMTIGIDHITQFDTTDHKVKIAAEVKDFEPTLYMDKKLARRYDRFLQFAIAATKEALEDSNLEGEDWKENAAVIVASGIGGFKTLYKEFLKMEKKGPRVVSPFLIPMMISDMASGVVSIEFGLKGPNFNTVSACASSLHAIIMGSMLIRHGYVDVAIVGGTEATIDPMPIAAFANMMALSTRNDDPKTASRPFDKDRDGFVMAEGAGVIVLESEEHAKKRNANIYGYVEGFGMTGDAYHISAPDENGTGAAKAVELALEDAKVDPEKVKLANCHATSTPAGDIAETRALRSAFGEHAKKIYIQGTKSLVGHGLGAAAAIEFIGMVLQMKEGFIHGMPSLFEPNDELKDLNFPKETIEEKVEYAIKNSFGFGGHNASIVYKSL
ncbi:3-oxoacyl-ACP synthase [Marinitoga sp. 1135]|uniref:3-oxoacyl-[acyl-carrier-protein] synthase 2 n=1 Tax=Marinitoga piezophila (strain DSM 14283 / JCM 11233 / KA3) TaxID=443254 RepID=H2J2Q8_MARPK|nr:MULTISPECIES: beta-ketoacyl-ACP synthase II [Marinitoga]AEX84502.1 beta-ketoacyl-acyl-carrier-protein synthase II [Marinitoga piezophila KA3]APT74996.1 3-oxoacyl-ACP synthase [Marinitoga sp. 1137]NUU94752.1 3-oxoacyl-ACP synthase [Marinitoga sp. 1135]NUU96681.1 3-oxoacyl-ACP synthase [Marinitoga sp. 1138]